MLNYNADSTAGSFGNTFSPATLSHPPPAPPPAFVTFQFTSFNPTLLDSTVLGPSSQFYFHVSTASRPLRYTAVRDSTNEAITVIEWLKHPVIEIRDALTKQAVSQWLVLSSDKSYRTMNFDGRSFVWSPEGNYVCLYSTGLEAPRIYARIFRDANALALDLTAEAINMGMLDVCVAAALVLQSGRNID
ncbi:hypothetical protein C8R44DRAFT_627037 [Mycena epipterygia]|nr:hypothetical protein C8R44DRAFT_627037 [Mycena epipterygia]